MRIPGLEYVEGGFLRNGTDGKQILFFSHVKVHGRNFWTYEELYPGGKSKNSCPQKFLVTAYRETVEDIETLRNSFNMALELIRELEN